MEDQYENLSKIAQMLVLIEKLKLSGNLRDAQVWEQKLFQLMQKRQQEREQADFFKYVGSTDDETDNNIFNAVLPLIRNESEFVRFVFEELDAASHGGDFAKKFAKESGIVADYYRGALNSESTIDRAGGPQQVLSYAVMSIYGPGSEVGCFHRIQIVKKFIKYGMEMGYLLKYKS
jgi:hypothetical protein